MSVQSTYFPQLPRSAKQALIQYFVIECGSESFGTPDVLLLITERPTEAQWHLLIHHADTVWQNQDYKIDTVSLVHAMQYVWDNSSDLREEHDDFLSYHADYIAGGDMPTYTEANWPLLALPECGEALLDGWHRLHRYIQLEVSEVSIIYL